MAVLVVPDYERPGERLVVVVGRGLLLFKLNVGLLAATAGPIELRRKRASPIAVVVVEVLGASGDKRDLVNEPTEP